MKDFLKRYLINLAIAITVFIIVVLVIYIGSLLIDYWVALIIYVILLAALLVTLIEKAK